MRHTDAILARLAEAEAELEAIAGLRGGRLRMAAFESAGATLMPLAIATFRSATRRRAVAALAEPEDALPQLKSGELDLALAFEPTRSPPATTASSASTCSTTRCSSRCRPTTRSPQAQPAARRPGGRAVDRGHAELRVRPR